MTLDSDTSGPFSLGRVLVVWPEDSFDEQGMRSALNEAGLRPETGFHQLVRNGHPQFPVGLLQDDGFVAVASEPGGREREVQIEATLRNLLREPAWKSAARLVVVAHEQVSTLVEVFLARLGVSRGKLQLVRVVEEPFDGKGGGGNDGYLSIDTVVTSVQKEGGVQWRSCASAVADSVFALPAARAGTAGVVLWVVDDDENRFRLTAGESAEDRDRLAGLAQRISGEVFAECDGRSRRLFPVHSLASYSDWARWRRDTDPITREARDQELMELWWDRVLQPVLDARSGFVALVDNRLSEHRQNAGSQLLRAIRNLRASGEESGHLYTQRGPTGSWVTDFMKTDSSGWLMPRYVERVRKAVLAAMPLDHPSDLSAEAGGDHSEEDPQERFGDLVGSCPAMLDAFARVRKVAQTDVSVLIAGETGTGKELIAREIHGRSNRTNGPFIAINCGAIPETLMESELFGHVRGAFTGAVATQLGKFQAAVGGTIFLDEVGELPLALQVKLLRVLQDKVVVKVGDTKPERVDVRVLAATNKLLEEEVRAQRFREDLYYRLNVVTITLPPVRERGEDIVALANYLMHKYREEFSSPVTGFSPEALAAIRRFDWPGNVRELENRIKKAIVLCETAVLVPKDLDLPSEDLARDWVWATVVCQPALRPWLGYILADNEQAWREQVEQWGNAAGRGGGEQVGLSRGPWLKVRKRLREHWKRVVDDAVPPWLQDSATLTAADGESARGASNTDSAPRGRVGGPNGDRDQGPAGEEDSWMLVIGIWKAASREGVCEEACRALQVGKLENEGALVGLWTKGFSPKRRESAKRGGVRGKAKPACKSTRSVPVSGTRGSGKAGGRDKEVEYGKVAGELVTALRSKEPAEFDRLAASLKDGRVYEAAVKALKKVDRLPEKWRKQVSETLTGAGFQGSLHHAGRKAARLVRSLLQELAEESGGNRLAAIAAGAADPTDQ